MKGGALHTALALLMVPVACGPGHQHGAVRDAPAAIPAQVERALGLPPTRGASSALATLEQRHDTCAGTWLRARYLVDLFDWVRLLPRDDSDVALETLWRGCGLTGAPSRGNIATRKVVDALERLMRRTTSRCEGRDPRRRSSARTGLELLQMDRASRADPTAALEVAVAYRRIVHSDTPLAANARLRLVDWCAQAFRLAAGGDARDQHARLNQCLFPLFPADPRPYFAEPNQRPPDPPWTVLRAAMKRERDRLLQTRLAPLARRLAAQDAGFFAEAMPVLPAPLRLSTLDLPRTQDGIPWDRTPVIVVVGRGYLVDGRAVLEHDDRGLERAIAARIHNDGRRHVTLVAERSVLASRILDLGRAARRADVTTMGLAGVRAVARPTRGDVQQLVFGAKPVLRLEEIPVSLELLAATTAGAPSRGLPRGMAYDPRTAQGRLALLLGRDGARVVSRDGHMGPFGLKDLPAQLARARRVYTEDRSIVLAPDKTTTYEDLLAVAAAVRRHDGRPLFPGIALAPRIRVTVPEADLETFLRVLADARVEVTPQLNRSWSAMARQCYLETLRGRVGKPGPLPAGSLRVATGPQGVVRVLGGSLRHGGLRRCLQRRLATVPIPPGAGPVTLTFSH